MGGPLLTGCEIRGIGIIGARMPLPQCPNNYEIYYNTLAHVKIWCNRDSRQKKETEFSKKLGFPSFMFCTFFLGQVFLLSYGS